MSNPIITRQGQVSVSKKLTKISVYGTMFSGLGLMGYITGAFLFGYHVTFYESNLVIASIELIWVIIVITLCFGYFNNEVLK